MAGEVADFVAWCQIVVFIIGLIGIVVLGGLDEDAPGADCQKVNKIRYCLEDGVYVPYIRNYDDGNFTMTPITYEKKWNTTP